jgi:hypothetical protein
MDICVEKHVARAFAERYEMEYIFYKKGYKYQLTNDYSALIPIKPIEDIDTDYIDLSVSGFLVIKNGYAWDGPSGPTIDSPSFMRGSLVHDALYQLMRAEKLDGEIYRKPADQLLQQMCIHDGMSSFRAWIVYHALRFGGGSAADPARKKQPVKAPDFANVENGGE